MARARFREGVQFYDKQQYEKARLAFLQAYALKPHPSVLLNLAQSELRGGRPIDAATHFGEYLKSPAATGPEKHDAEAGLAAAKAKVGELTVSADPGAQIVVDGESRGVAPLAGPLYLTPGRHVVEARSGDHKVGKPVTAMAGQAAQLDLSPGASSTGVAAASSATTPPRAEQEPKPEPEGSPEPASKEPHAAEAEPAEPESAKADTHAEAPEGGGFLGWFARSPLAWVGAGVGLVGLGAGGVFTAMWSDDRATANNFRMQIANQWGTKDLPVLQGLANSSGDPNFVNGAGPCPVREDLKKYLVTPADSYASACSQWSNAKDAANREETLAIVSFAVGGAAIAGTVVYYFIDADGKSGSGTAKAPRGFQARVMPVVGSGISGVSLTGRF